MEVLALNIVVDGRTILRLIINMDGSNNNTNDNCGISMDDMAVKYKEMKDKGKDPIFMFEPCFIF